MYTRLYLMKLNAPPLTAPLPLYPVLPSRTQRFLKGYRRQYFPHLLHLRPRRGILDRRLQLPRPRTTGPERRRFAFHHGLPPAPTIDTDKNNSPVSRTARLIRPTNRLLSKLRTGRVTTPGFERKIR
jgi:hypothetical protein